MLLQDIGIIDCSILDLLTSNTTIYNYYTTKNIIATIY